ncbi:MAG: CNNM domain-containing protein [Planctomycetota bacterium]
MVSSAFIILLALFLVILAGFFAGSETGMYQLSRLRLRIGVENRRFSFIILAKLMDDSSSLLITMLIGNNLLYNLVTSLVAYLLLNSFVGEHSVELLTTLITAPVLFVFAELIPKSLFYHHCDSLMPVSAPLLMVFHKIAKSCGAVWLLKFISRIFSQLTPSGKLTQATADPVASPYVKAIFEETHDEGFLSGVQAEIINRIVNISKVLAGEVMTKLSQTYMVTQNTDKSTLLENLKQCEFTRIPVYENKRDNIAGFINIYELLCSKDDFANLGDLIKPMQKIDAAMTVTDAINVMQKQNQKIVLVTRHSRSGREIPVGIVTMKDLVEELLGELSEW